MSRIDDLRQFYRLLGQLERACGGVRTLAAAHGRLNWPERGVYFFFEPGEHRSHSGEGLRVVRIGTHAVSDGSKTKLWNRLSQHQGTVKSGGGNHRGSIFRLILGEAIAVRDPSQSVPTWGQGSSAVRNVRDGEIELEQRVSEAIRIMPFLWLSIDDPPSRASDRAYIERNAIALLSNFGETTGTKIDPPSAGWLGSLSPRSRISKSGLWNQRHVDEHYDQGFLTMLDTRIFNML